MKIPVTEQFLWDIYSELEKVGDIAHFFLKPRHTMRDIYTGIDSPWEKRYLKELSREQFSKLIYHLKRYNFIKVKNLEGKMAVIITKKGIDKAIKASFKIESQNNKKKRKDGKWIMVIFDVPKKDESRRRILRSILQNLGYKMFQKSVWITPYNVFDKTEELFQFYFLDKYVRLFLVEDPE